MILRIFIKNIAGTTKLALELFPDDYCGVHSYIINQISGPVAVLVNPPGGSKMVEVRTLEKYSNSMKIFKKLNLPLISIVDTPGADPRVEQGDLNIVNALCQTTADIIDYPHPKMSIIMGRCFGGASVLAIPKFYGSTKTLAVKGSKAGIMGESIIRQLLSGSERLLNEWEENVKNEKDDLSDFIEVGVIDRLIEENEIRDEIRKFYERILC